ncbi:EAL domain-containing protein [Pseudidiomarina sp. 1APP75-27a]|uniref:sensor domain-containing phosphodiesterase n=1 Tax=Pseudidiomarina terrestris TaxID=2820060 RepID=UPI002B05542E|nr:EAL domain-containing protein [Pseudidiomarina sp. 1APP75-27a]MEA3587302.1 EAL domain-containing protein [Pseudidiomarina sp. 1APP75-27a]
MQQHSYTFKDEEAFKNFINDNALREHSGLLQILSSRRRHEVKPFLRLLKEYLPGFSLFGASTAGEIIQGQIAEQTLLLNFLVFEQGTTASLVRLEDHSPAQLSVLKDKLDGVRPDVMIMFANPLADCPEKFVTELKQRLPSTIIAGGNAADNFEFNETYTILGEQIFTTGSVMAILSGDNLMARQESITGWSGVGPQFTVTKAEDNVLYELDDEPISQVYENYLGKLTLDNLPISVMEFPFLVQRPKMSVLRSAIGRIDDGIAFGGKFEVGDKVMLSFADPQELINQTPAYEAAADVATLIFSCAARKSYLASDVSLEMSKVGRDLKASGGFFFGEYYTVDSDFHMLNLSTTLLFLSEGQELPEATTDTTQKRLEPSALKSLAHLSRTTARELQDTINFLEQQQKALNYNSIVSITDTQGKITYVNEKFEEVSGYSRDELIGNTHALVRHPDTPDKVFANLWRSINSGKPWKGLIKNRRKNGRSYYVQTAIVPIIGENNLIQEFLSIRNDVSNIVEARRTIQEQSHDPLTGLPNRVKLLMDLQKQETCKVGVFDVRNLKIINEYWGISHGDKLIKSIATALQKAAKKYDLNVYHLSGASFSIRMNAGCDESQFNKICEDLKNELEEIVYQVDDDIHEVFFCVGIGESYAKSMILAESALDEAKHCDYGSQIVAKTEQNDVKASYFWIEEVKSALKEDRLVPFFQEIRAVNCSEHSRKFEALARVKMPNGEVLVPGLFLDSLKKTPYYGVLTRTMFSKSMATLAIHNCKISINLSIRDILNEATTEFILRELHRSGGERVIFEITESEAIQEFAAVKDFFGSLRAAGAAIAIDDFGSGYSNFAYLVELKPEFIKIDGSIIKKIAEDDSSRKITKSIIDMAHSLGIKTIAEFVSDAEIYQILEWLNIDFVQGYYISKPKESLEEI